MNKSIEIIKQYYAAFNSQNYEGMIALLDPSFEHYVNEGSVRKGQDLFRKFMKHMDTCYRENLTDLVFMSNEDGSRVAAEFVVNGVYLKTDSGLPEAREQKYRLPAGAFFEIQNGKIKRLTNYYNLNDWIAQVKWL